VSQLTSDPRGYADGRGLPFRARPLAALSPDERELVTPVLLPMPDKPLPGWEARRLRRPVACSCGCSTCLEPGATVWLLLSTGELAHPRCALVRERRRVA
jgi:hypothetical protein